MTGYTNLFFILLLSFSFSLFCITATLLYFLCRIHRQPPLHGDAELGGNVTSFKTPILHSLCCRIQSRVEPTGELPGAEQVKFTQPAAGSEEEECVLVRWRAEAFGRSRLLYTIREEEREGVESDGEGVCGSGGSGEDEMVKEEEEEEGDVLFSTPCPSPAFYTPASSPTRSPEKAGNVASGLSPVAQMVF